MPVPAAVALQPCKIVVEKLLDLVHFDALVLHLGAVLAESGVDVDDEVGQTFDLDVVLFLELFDHIVHFDAVLFEQEFVDLFESYLGGLLDFYFLEL